MSTISSNRSPNNDLAEQYRAQQAEKEEMQASHEREITNLKKSYEIEKAALVDRFESSLQADKQKHYDNLKNTKRQADREQRDLEARKDALLGQKQSEFSREQVEADAAGRKAVDETKSKYASAMAHEEKEMQDAQVAARLSHRKSAQAIVSDSEKKIGELHAQKQVELENAKARSQEAIEQTRREVANTTQMANDNYRKQLQAVQIGTQADLDQRRLQNAQWLNSYSERAQDPFYHMVRADAEITDLGDTYKIRVKVPEHERQNFKIQVSGQEIQLSGTRSNSEKVEVQPGNWISTSTFQNYTERYPLEQPVDARSLSVQENGDWMEYTLTKFGPNHKFSDQGVIRETPADRVHQVDFPDSLPKPTVLPKRTKSSGTLS